MPCELFHLHVAWFAWIILASIPPLSPDQIRTLVGARDGVDGLDDAFAVLVEHVQQWPESLGTGGEPAPWQATPARHGGLGEPHLAAMVRDPAAYRGDLCRLRGRLEQHRALPAPHQTMQEWFIRVDSPPEQTSEGTARQDAPLPVLIYVANPSAVGRIQDGRRYELIARFYKVVDATARDGTRRTYPAFVGRIIPISPTSTAWRTPMIVALPILVLGGAYLLLRWRLRRGRTPSRGRVAACSSGGTDVLDDSADLPDDPAAALAELHRRQSV